MKEKKRETLAEPLLVSNRKKSSNDRDEDIR
jgi:hypothetical protein